MKKIFFIIMLLSLVACSDDDGTAVQSANYPDWDNIDDNTWVTVSSQKKGVDENVFCQNGAMFRTLDFSVSRWKVYDLCSETLLSDGYAMAYMAGELTLRTTNNITSKYTLVDLGGNKISAELFHFNGVDIPESERYIMVLEKQ